MSNDNAGNGCPSCNSDPDAYRAFRLDGKMVHVCTRCGYRDYVSTDPLHERLTQPVPLEARPWCGAKEREKVKTEHYQAEAARLIQALASSPRHLPSTRSAQKFVRRERHGLARLAEICGAVKLTPATDSNPWMALRLAWLQVLLPGVEKNISDFVYGDTPFVMELCLQHQNAVKALVANGELRQDVATVIATMYDQVIDHIQRSTATCYMGLPPCHQPRNDLVAQGEALTAMSQSCDIDPATVARIRIALERDMAWLTEYAADKTPADIEYIVAREEEVEAARILAELLLTGSIGATHD